jgi:hypothetical protein
VATTAAKACISFHPVKGSVPLATMTHLTEGSIRRLEKLMHVSPLLLICASREVSSQSLPCVCKIYRICRDSKDLLTRKASSNEKRYGSIGATQLPAGRHIFNLDFIHLGSDMRVTLPFGELVHLNSSSLTRASRALLFELPIRACDIDGKMSDCNRLWNRAT